MAICRLRALLSISKYKSAPCPIYHSIQVHNLSSSSCNVSSQIESVGFIGLGNMGSRMANNLIKAGYKVTVHDM